VVELKIRKIRLGEIEEIAGVLAEESGGDLEEVREHTEWHVKGFPEICLAAEQGGEVVGFVICHLHSDSLEIEDLYAREGYEHAYKALIEEVLRRIPPVDTVTIWMDDFKKILGRLG